VLFPLFTGLFGISNLLLSWATNASLPPQSLESRGGDLSRKRKTRAVLGGSLAGAIVGWFPGIGGASATTLAKLLAGDREEGGEEEGREVIMAMAGVNASTAVFTMVALFIILRARSGTMVAIQELTATSLQPWEPFTSPPTALVLLLMAATLASLLGFLYAFALGRLLARHASRVPYRTLVATVTVLLVLLIFLFTGPLGLAVASVATAVGLLPPLLGVRRVHLMGALLLPVIVFLLGL
jgi:putative membrane protein